MTNYQRKSGMCPCGTAQRRPGQGYCYKCHAQEQRIYRAKQRETLERARAIVQQDGVRKIVEQLSQTSS